MRWIVGCFLFGLSLAFAAGDKTYVTPVDRPNGLGEIVYQLPAEEMLPEGICFLSSQTEDWSHKALNIAESRKFTKGKGGKLAILDTGIDSSHPEFRGRIKASKNFTNSPSAGDMNGHGTHCAGIAAAADDGEGTVGIAPECDLYIAKVLNDRGMGLTSWIAEAVKWAVDDCGVDVISMSLGAPSYDGVLHEAIKYAVSQGVIVVAAAGNEGPGNNTVGYPGGHEEVICVGSTGQNGLVSRFSSRGPQVFLGAPGEAILATLPANRFGRLSGTSMATPAVAGEVVLIQAFRKTQGKDRLTPHEVKEILFKTIVDIDPKGKDVATGWGRPEIAKALEVLAKVPNPMPPPDPKPDPKPEPIPDSVFIYPADLTEEKLSEILKKWPNFKYLEIRNKIEVIVHVE